MAMAVRMCASLSGDLASRRVSITSWGEGALLRCRAQAAEALFLSTLPFAAAAEHHQQQQQQRRLFYGRRGGGDSWYHSPVSMPDSETLVLATSQADRVASLAVRAWRTLGDADRADELYNRALELAPENSSILANYAEFLWQCDV